MTESEKAAFSRRGYYIEDVDGKRQKVEIVVNIGNQKFAQVELDGDGLIAVVARPGEPGFWVEVVKPGGPRLTEDSSREIMESQGLRDWQAAALVGEED